MYCSRCCSIHRDRLPQLPRLRGVNAPQVPDARDALQSISLIGWFTPGAAAHQVDRPPLLPPSELMAGLAGSRVPFFNQTYEGWAACHICRFSTVCPIHSVHPHKRRHAVYDPSTVMSSSIPATGRTLPERANNPEYDAMKAIIDFKRQTCKDDVNWHSFSKCRQSHGDRIHPPPRIAGVPTARSRTAPPWHGGGRCTWHAPRRKGLPTCWCGSNGRAPMCSRSSRPPSAVGAAPNRRRLMHIFHPHLRSPSDAVSSAKSV